MSTPEIFTTDNLGLYFNVADEENSGEMKDITGATVEAEAQVRDGNASAIEATTVSIADAAAGRVYVHFAKGSFDDLPGRYAVQLRVALGATDLKTVGVQFVTVKQSSKV